MRYLRKYLAQLMTPLLPSPASGYGDDGIPNFVNQFCALNGSLRHFRWVNTWCYRIHYPEVRDLLRSHHRSLASDRDILEYKFSRHHPGQMRRRRFAAVVRELRVFSAFFPDSHQPGDSHVSEKVW